MREPEEIAKSGNQRPVIVRMNIHEVHSPQRSLHLRLWPLRPLSTAVTYVDPFQTRLQHFFPEIPASPLCLTVLKSIPSLTSVYVLPSYLPFSLLNFW
jgi:hypothetical protein